MHHLSRGTVSVSQLSLIVSVTHALWALVLSPPSDKMFCFSYSIPTFYLLSWKELHTNTWMGTPRGRMGQLPQNQYTDKQSCATEPPTPYAATYMQVWMATMLRFRDAGTSLLQWKHGGNELKLCCWSTPPSAKATEQTEATKMLNGWHFGDNCYFGAPSICRAPCFSLLSYFQNSYVISQTLCQTLF